jgi:predicted regulator of Ras-like GTPase activity (Roadblock/LC7/MglB family)
MGFREHLEEICQKVEGAVACSLMGSDGIEVDTHVIEGGEVDFRTLLIEYSGLLGATRDAAAASAAGAVTELSVHTEKMIVVARVVSPEYYMVVALTPDGNYGKARYYLRVTAPKLLSEL